MQLVIKTSQCIGSLCKEDLCSMVWGVPSSLPHGGLLRSTCSLRNTVYVFGDCVIENLCSGACVCYLCFPQVWAVCWSSAQKQEYHCLLSRLAKCWKSHHQQSTFQCECVLTKCICSDKLVKLWRLTFAPVESCLYLGELSDIRMIHLLLQDGSSVALQVKSNSCCWHVKQGRQAD